jgi:3-keto-5-aminohexanoate cleavage enzyme
MSRRTPLIMVAPNGARHGKEQHPALPVTEAELVETAVACHAAGAGAIHIHVRDETGRHVLDVDRYNSAVPAIRRATGDAMLVQVTTEAVGRYTPEEVEDVFARVDAQAISVAMRELIPSADHESLGARTLAEARRKGMAIQHLLYTPDELSRFVTLVERGIVPDEDLDVLFVLGRYGGDDTDTRNLSDYMTVLRQSSIEGKAEWTVCAFGPPETRALAAAMAMGGKARVGFENNFRQPDGTTAPDNAARVAVISRIAREMGLS